MKLEMFSVHDSKAEAFIQPIFAPTTAVALRLFKQAANDPNSDFCKFAADYTLFHVATFCQDTGTMEALATPESVALAITLQDPKEL